MTETNLRKEDHIRLCLEQDIQARSVKTGFEEVFFIHRALPENRIEDIDLTTTLFNHRLSAPIIIEAMTGGTEKAARINATLAEAAEALGLAMGVGSQRVAIENPDVAYTFKIVRKKAPNTFLIANLGAAQIKEYDLKTIKKSVEMIDANALAFHLNPLQEIIQPEGNSNYQGLLKKLEKITSSTSIPIIAKETGAGIAAEESRYLEAVGVQGIDVSGAGGTSWAAVETWRAKAAKNNLHSQLGETFWDWGIPTVVSLVEVRQSVHIRVIASGGLKTGLDAAKAISLGADAAGFAYHLLRPAVEGKVMETLDLLIHELKTAMFLIGTKSITELKASPVVIMGKTAQWLGARGYHPEEYARRTKRGKRVV
ncbi:MAG: type 2 isopentenyl-diphosphate Delta-isomerase [Candidatus Hodarchaeota archaeon]